VDGLEEEVGGCAAKIGYGKGTRNPAKGKVGS
jgi:hypothetical protein